jgi:4-amino-4-deoxy-L-arabinose transferase-like glycosyltransferase
MHLVEPISKAALPFLLGIYFLTATAYNMAIPIGEAPDEIPHIEYVRILSSTGQLPTIPRDSPRYNYEAEQPPFYYLLQAMWMRLLWPSSRLVPDMKENPAFSFRHMRDPANVYLHEYPASDAIPAHFIRLLSTLIGVAMLVLVWVAARFVWPHDRDTAVIATGLAALLPGSTFIFAIVSNDTLAGTLGAAILFMLLVSVRRGISLRWMLLTGIVLGVGILTKRSLLVLLPLLIVVPLLAPAPDRRTRWLSIATGFAAAIAVGAWPFIYNLTNYGDPFASAVTEQAKQAIDSPLGQIPAFWLLPGYVVNLFNSLWGVFGLRNIELPTIVYGFYYVLCGLALLGILYHHRVKRAGKDDTTIVLVLAVTVLLIYAGVAYQNTHFWAIQGRLLLPGFAALVLLLGYGLSQLGRHLINASHSRALVVVVLLVSLTFLNWYALVWHLIPAYYR